MKEQALAVGESCEVVRATNAWSARVAVQLRKAFLALAAQQLSQVWIVAACALVQRVFQRGLHAPADERTFYYRFSFSAHQLALQF